MRAEIISIGTELLVGSILNTNARFLSQALASHAIDVYHQVTVGDNVGRIVESLKAAARRADILITSGGLGPTEDDVTTRAVCRFLNKEPVFHEPTFSHIKSRLKKRRRRMTRLIQRQCGVPQAAIVFKNENGTAPGTLSEFYSGGEKKWLLVLPGPPGELEPMFRRIWPVLFRLAEIPKEHFVIRSVRIAGLIEAEAAQKVTDLLKFQPPLTVGIYAKPNEVELKIMAKCAGARRTVPLRMVRRAEQIIRRRFKNYVYGTDEDTLASVTGKLLREKRKTLSIAESCTGGLLCNWITGIPGSSDYFMGGVVSYHDRVKSRELGIEESLLKKYGAVSGPVAKKMAENIRKIFGTDFGIGITGIAGPGGGSKKKPAGLVYIALADAGTVQTTRNMFLGGRSDIQAAAAHRALDILRLKLLKKR